MSLLTLFLASALADAAPEECSPATLSQSIPAAEAVNVPIDIAPLLIFRGNCGLSASYTVRLTASGDPTPLFETTYDASDFAIAGENDSLLEPDFGLLTADTDYIVQVTNDFGEDRQFGFSTGQGVVEPITTGLPTVQIESAQQDKLSRDFYYNQIDLSITSAGAGDGAYIISREGVEIGALVATGPTTPYTIFWNDSTLEDRMCVTVVERDPSGALVGPSAESCAEVTASRGCSHTSPWLAGWMILPLLGLRRSR